MITRANKAYKDSHLNDKEKAFKDSCEKSFAAFVHGVSPWLMTGHIHDDVCSWIQKNHEKGVSHLLALLPRGHLKSTIAYLYGAWRIVLDPSITIIYASASNDLAEMQVNSIKNVLTSDIVTYLWQNLCDPEEGKRSVWRTKAISVDHPYRKETGVRDYTLRAISIGTGVTGSHVALLILDDVVAPESDRYSPWTAEGRDKLKAWYSFIAGSVLNPESDLLAVGTRYHAKDLYGELIDSEEDIVDEHGEVLERRPVFEYMIRTVKEGNDFLWPRKQSINGEWYGFNEQVLAKIKASYLDAAKFYSQYYQNPIDPEGGAFTQEFKYYEKEKVIYRRGRFYIQPERGQEKLLNVFASVDIASTENKNSDYTAIVVIGVDSENNRYILDIDRFQTERISVISDRVFSCFDKWRFRRIRIETVASQRFVFTQVRDDMRAKNVFFNIDDYTPPVKQGKKPERIRAILEPLYNNGQMIHYRGGNCEILEDELVLHHPPHDDIADALASVNEIAQRPSVTNVATDKPTKVKFHPRFGGVIEV